MFYWYKRMLSISKYLIERDAINANRITIGMVIHTISIALAGRMKIHTPCRLYSVSMQSTVLLNYSVCVYNFNGTTVSSLWGFCIQRVLCYLFVQSKAHTQAKNSNICGNHSMNTDRERGKTSSHLPFIKDELIASIVWDCSRRFYLFQ